MDYPEIIHNPMDFMTIKNNLMKGGKYVVFEDVFNDI
jgi:hypothetical protein